jgi:hypothetical protein
VAALSTGWPRWARRPPTPDLRERTRPAPLRERSLGADDGLVATLARPLLTLAALRVLLAHRRGAGAALAVFVMLVFAAAPAGALVTKIGSTTVGLQPRTEALTEGEANSFANESGHVVLHGTNLYTIYWDPKNQFHHEWLTRIDSFFQRMGASGEMPATSEHERVPAYLGSGFASLGQYHDRSNQGATYQTVFKASYSDTSKYPPGACTDPNTAFTKRPITCLTDLQMREQLQSFITSHGLPTGMHSIFYLLTPPGVAVCVDVAATRCSDYKVSASEEGKEERLSTSYKESFCSYHSAISPTNEEAGDEHTVLYAVIPWSAGTAGDALAPAARVYTEAFDCQDGGWNAEKGEEKFEKAKERSPSEAEEFTKGNAEEKARITRIRQLEGPHQQEPNQEAKSESVDYSAGLADLIINQIAVQQANTVTDPLLNAWQDPTGHEVTDECRNEFAGTAASTPVVGVATADEHTEAGTLSNTQLSSPELGAGPYYLNNDFSVADGACVGAVGLIARFTAPNTVNSNEVVGLDGMESTVSLITADAFAATGPPTKTYATFSWNFGDGTAEVKGFAPGAPLCEQPWLSPCAASVFHSYQYGGHYTVTLTATDVAGNTAHVTHEVTVLGPPAPPPGPGEQTHSTSTTSTAPIGSTGHPPTGATGHELAPVATAAIVSKSLRSVGRNKRLLVRYTVSEQVTGRLELLLSSSIAHHLGVRGSNAAGLPAGTAAQTVIGRALLVTTKAGHSTLTIQLSKTTAAQLRRLHKLSLMLRLVVHNASAETATMFSSSTLGA